MKQMTLLQSALDQYNSSEDTDSEEEEFFEIIFFEDQKTYSDCPENCTDKCFSFR